MLINDYINGGLKMIDPIIIFCRYFKVMWVKRLISHQMACVKHFPKHYLQNLLVILFSHSTEVNLLN